MRNFAVIVVYKNSNISSAGETHLFCVKAYSGVEAKEIAKARYIDNYEFVLPVKQMIEDEDVVFNLYEVNMEDFK